MRKIFASTAAIVPGVLLAACSGGSDDVPAPSPDSGTEDNFVATRPSGQPDLVAFEGRLEEGTECLVLHTPDGERWALSEVSDDFQVDDYVEVSGVRADASFCMEGEGTIIASRIFKMQAPAQDRDPARSGGIALSEDYVTGSWTASGLEADCDQPYFQISQGPGAIVIETSVNGLPETGRVVLGDYPHIDWDDPLPDTPLESRGPDGLAVLRPATDAAYDPISVGGHRILGDGVEFIKCG